MATRPRAEIDITARNRVQRAIDQAQTQLRGLDRVARTLTGAFAGLATIQLGRQFVEMADRAKTVENRLKLVTESSTELAQVQSDLFRLAQSSNASFEGTVELYARLARATSELGISQSRLLSVTETINQAIAVSGASSQEAQAALIQLSQGLAAGALRGEELNSVMEQTPRLAQAIAAGMGITIGQLREMGKEGRLTAGAVIQALESQADVISREYGQMEMTVGQAMQRLSNSVLKAIGSVDQASGFSHRLAQAIDAVSRAVDGMVTAAEKADESGFGRMLDRIRETIEESEDLSRAAAAAERGLGAWFEEVAKASGPFGTAIVIAEKSLDALEEAERRNVAAMTSLNVALSEQARMLRESAQDRQRVAQERAAEAAAEREELEKRLEKIREFAMSREELERESHRKRLEDLRRAFEARVIDEASFHELSIQLAQKTQERLDEIYRSSEEGRRHQQSQDQLEQLREFLLTEEELELESHRRRLENLRVALEEGHLTKAQFDEMSIALAQKTQERIDEIRRTSEEAKRREDLQRQLDQVVEQSLTREQVELEAHRRRLEILAQAFEEELITKERFDELAIELARRTQERITEIQLQEERKRGKSTRDVMLAQVQSTLQSFALLAQAHEGGSKRLFKIHKALALASAIVSTHKSVAEALATPPAPNIPLALLAAAKGAAEIAGITSTNFGGGGSASFAGGGGGAAAPAAPQLPRIPDRSEARGAVHIEVSLAGATIVGPGGAEQFAETLVEILRDRVSNRDEVIISANSRQAAELRG